MHRPRTIVPLSLRVCSLTVTEAFCEPLRRSTVVWSVCLAVVVAGRRRWVLCAKLYGEVRRGLREMNVGERSAGGVTTSIRPTNWIRFWNH